MRRRSSERVRAAISVQRWYRRLVASRSLTGLDRTRQVFFAACKALENEAQIAFPCFRVQVLYRNALPRILTCLDIVVTHLESVKTQIRQEFEVLDQHEKLEAISDKLEGVKCVPFDCCPQVE